MKNIYHLEQPVKKATLSALKYRLYDEASGYVKVPSQQLSDALVEAFKDRLKND